MMKTITYNSDILEVELEALKWGLEIALSLSAQKGYTHKLEVVSDRRDIIEAFNGTGDNIRMTRYREDVQKLLKQLEGRPITIGWCPRKENLAGIALEGRLKILKNSAENIVFRHGRRKKKFNGF